MSRRVIAAGSAAMAVVIALALAACGGKVGGGITGDSSPAPSSDVPRPGPGPKQPPRMPPSASAAAVASQIAEEYCKTFSSCCVAAGQPPIDVSRCRTLTSAAVQPRLVNVDGASPDLVDACVASIRERAATCAREDVAWPTGAGRPELLEPSSVKNACSALTGDVVNGTAMPCAAGKGCPGGRTCAVDECSTNPGAGGSCLDDRCLDSLMCKAGVCAVATRSASGEPCVDPAECQLGLVCPADTQKCAPAREHPELYVDRNSPYRVGADTCRAFNFL